MNDVYVHPAALVESEHIGEGSRIWAFTHVMKGAQIGRRCNIGDHCFIEGGARIGDDTTIKNTNMIWDGVTLEDGVFVGPNVVFTNDRYPRSPRLPLVAERYQSKDRWLAPTVVRQGASLGAGAVILANVTIGEYAMVAAGAVVTKNVLPHALVRGNPARIAGWVCRCGVPLQFQSRAAQCGECGLQYMKSDDDVHIRLCVADMAG